MSCITSGYIVAGGVDWINPSNPNKLNSLYPLQCTPNEQLNLWSSFDLKTANSRRGVCDEAHCTNSSMIPSFLTEQLLIYQSTSFTSACSVYIADTECTSRLWKLGR